MLKMFRAILAGQSVRAERSIEIQNAALIIEGKVAEAERGQSQAKTALAALITRTKSERRALGALEKRIADLESRIRQALEAQQTKLAEDAAQMLASMENERHLRQETLRRSDEKAQRLKLAIEKTHRQLIDLQQGLMTARAIGSERRAFRQVKGDINARSAIRDGEAVLQRLLRSEDPVDLMESLDEIEADLSGDRIIQDMTNAGFGDPLKLRGADILARIKSEIGSVKPSKKPKSA